VNLFPRWILNSFIIAGIRILITAVFATMAGYALARLRFPGKDALFFFIIFTMMVPGQVTFISNYLVVRDGVFGLSKLLGMNTFLNTFWALFLPSLVSTSAVFMMKQFMESIPKEIEEAARIDGASTFRIYTRIILPLCKPAIAAVAGILTFQGSWNEFFWPMVVLTQDEKFTLPIGLNFFLHYYQSVTGSVWGMILAGTVISVIPVLIIYIIFQRYFIEGFNLSGIKQ
jgi:multiple sugar transport system permease protein